jgi:hypothetical protein
MRKKPKTTPKRIRSVGRTVWQTVYKVTVLSEEQISPHIDIADVVKEFTDGATIGGVEIIQQKTIHPRYIRRKLRAIGNDGSFFDTGAEDE